MHLLRPLLATLAISLTLPLSAAPEEVHVDTEPYEVPAGDTKNFSDHMSNLSGKDVEGALFWFRLQPGATLTMDRGLTNATLLIETAAGPENPATLVFKDKYKNKGLEWAIASQKSPIKLLRAPDVPDGTLRLACDSWTEKDGPGYNNDSKPMWKPASITVDCNLIFDTPLPVDENGSAYMDKPFTIPSGCIFRLEAYSSNEAQFPEIAFADETSTLVFALGDNVASSDESLELPAKYCNLLTSSSSRFVFECNTDISLQQPFTKSPTIEIAGVRLYFSPSPQFGEYTPAFIMKKNSFLHSQNTHLPIVVMEGDGIVNVTSIKHLAGQGKISFRSTDGVSKTIPVETVHVEIGHELIVNGTVKNVRQITGDGTLVLTYFDSENTKNDLSAIDQVARASNFKGTLGFQLPPIQDYLLDFSQLKENNFPYIIAPRTEETTTIRSIKLRLEQYKNATISWPERYAYQKRLGFILVVSDPSAGKAIVPAFPEDLYQFTLLNTDGSPIDCTVEYGRKTNTLTWAPTTPGFAELPDDVNQMLAPDITQSAVTGKVISKYSVEEVTEALRTFSGIHEIVSRTDSTTETNIVDLHVDYEFGISRLTFVDGGKNILVEVSLSSDVTQSPTFLGDLTLFVNNEALKEVTELFSDEGTDKYGLIAPTGKTVRWFVVPYETLPKSGDVTISVTAEPPQAN